MCVQEAMSRKATCSTRTQTEEEDTDEREADSAKDKTDEVRPTKTTPNLGRKRKPSRNLRKKGELPLRPEPSKRNQMRILRKTRPTGRRVPKEDVRIGFHKPTTHEMKSAMFAKSTKADSDIELWHKRIGHINLNKL